AVFIFETLTDSHLTEGSKAILRIGPNEYPAEILHRLDDEVTIFAEPLEGELPPSTVPAATLVSEPWFLIESLAAAIDAMADGAPSLRAPLEALLERLRSVNPASESFASHAVPVDIDLNAAQESAAANALNETLWWVWGPPGTGKTRTLGAI